MIKQADDFRNRYALMRTQLIDWINFHTEKHEQVDLTRPLVWCTTDAEGENECISGIDVKSGKFILTHYGEETSRVKFNQAETEQLIYVLDEIENERIEII